MNNNPKISVIMGVYNGGEYLAEAIESILNQTFKDFEFIIIDDCSKDNSLKVIKEYAKEDSRIKIIINYKNLKLPSSLNKGLKIAKGKYIARMDADDIALPKRFEIQYQYLERHPEIFLVGSRVYNIDESGRIINRGKIVSNPEKIMRDLPKKTLFCHSSIIFRNEGFRYRPKFFNAEDNDLYLRLLSSKKNMTNLKKILIKYRVRKNSQSFSPNFDQQKFSILSREFYKQRMKKGYDDYRYFNPKEINNLSFLNLNTDSILIRKIFSDYYSFNYESLKHNYNIYFKKYGFNLKIFFVYILSFFGISFNRYLRRFLGFFV